MPDLYLVVDIMYDHNMNFWEIPSYLDAFLFEKENIICVYNNLVFTVFICFSFCRFSFHVFFLRHDCILCIQQSLDPVLQD